MACNRERRIDSPAAAEAVRARSTFNEKRNQEQRERGGQEPEGNIVHARERHIRRTDHQWHEPVAVTADDGGHDDEEHHDETMARDEHVIGLWVREILQARLGELKAHHDRQEAAYQSGGNREDQIHCADVFVVGRHDPTTPSGWMIGVSVVTVSVISCCVCHFICSQAYLNPLKWPGFGPFRDFFFVILLRPERA